MSLNNIHGRYEKYAHDAPPSPYVCPRCNHNVYWGDPYCSHCSLYLRWEDVLPEISKNISKSKNVCRGWVIGVVAAVFVLSALTVVVLLWATPKAQPDSLAASYQAAQSAYKQEDYVLASSIFFSLGDYLDSGERSQEATQRGRLLGQYMELEDQTEDGFYSDAEGEM